MILDDSIGFLITNTGRKLSQFLTVQFHSYAVTSEQWIVLIRLSEKERITQKELSMRSEKDPTNLTRILDQLERKGLVRRVANADDRRSFLIFVTDSGKTLIDKLIPVELETIGKMMCGISDKEIETLRQVMEKINANLEKQRNNNSTS